MSGILSKRSVLQKLRQVDPYEFEKFIAEVWEQKGYNTRVRAGSGDRGIDVIATCGNEKILIQVKRYSRSNKVGSQEVRKYATLYQQVEDADKVMIISTGFFTKQAETLALDLGVETIDADELFLLIEQNAVEEAVKLLNDQPSTTLSSKNKTSSPSLPSNDSSEDSDKKQRANPEQVFGNTGRYRRVANKQGIFDGCPDCGEQRLCLAHREKDGLIELKCPDCDSKWIETEKEEGWWIFKRSKHYGFAKVADGEVIKEKSTEAWNKKYSRKK